jgi:sulfite exporter TauE/SafE
LNLVIRLNLSNNFKGELFRYFILLLFHLYLAGVTIMITGYISILLLGLLGGFSHCLGMCGGFVMAYSLNLRSPDPLTPAAKWLKWKSHLLYNSGRIFTYMILGEIFGLLGSTLGFILAVKNLQGALEFLAGIIMLVMGIAFTGLWPGWFSTGFFPGVNIFKKIVAGLYKNLQPRNTFILGMILGLIPCGLVYAAGAKAVATQSPLGGMLTMMFFGLGTAPALFTLGISTELISLHWRRRLYRLAAMLLIIFAVLTILRGVDALGWHHFYWLP